MSFKKNKYTVIRNAIDKDLAIFLANYFAMKKQVFDTCTKRKYISPFEKILGFYETTQDQIPDTYCCYSDIAMDTLLLKVQPVMEKATNLKLYPSYTYARLYKKGDELKRHKDYAAYVSGKTKGIEVNLKPGDMLVYRGVDLEHWRKPFKGSECVQVFLHYNNQKTKGAKANIFDGRDHLGLPGWFKRNGI